MTVICESIKVLLTEDDEDDYMITLNLLAKIEGATFHLEWTGSYTAAVKTVKACPPSNLSRYRVVS